MSSNQKMFGYWQKVTDEKSAWDAAQMGGLPVLFFAFNMALVIFLLYGNRVLPDALSLIGVVLTIVMAVFAFRIRAKKPASLPYLLVIFLMFQAVTLVFALIGSLYAADLKLGLITFGVTAVLPVIVSIVALNGLSGWNWLRKNGIAMKF
ncbi:MAG: hypothetical protein ACPGVN_02985 [Alphaproteobacteria bacterium]